MSDGSDGAGGVGGSGGNSGVGNDASSNAADSVADAVSDAISGLAEAVSNALGGLDASGLSDALGGLANALGIDAKDLQGIVGAAVVGALTGGLPGAVMGVVNALAGGSLTDAARDAVAKGVPESLQPLANFAIDAFASRVPGASTSLQSALSTLASGALTNGRAPDIGDIGAVARSLTDVRSMASGLMSGLDVSSPEAAFASLESALNTGFAEARGIAADVANRQANSGSVYAGGGYGDFGNSVEALAVEVTRLLSR